MICSLHAQTSFIIPPHTEVLVAGELGDYYQVGETGFVLPWGDLPTRYYHILGAVQIVKTWEGNSIPVRLLNPTELPIKIFRCACLGTYIPEDPEINTYDLLVTDNEAEATCDIPTV